MAQVDLRHATLNISDGYTALGDVTTATPTAGLTTLAVSGFTVAIPNGSPFTIVGSTRTYTVISTVGGSTPTSITFTPALATVDGVPATGAIVTIGPHSIVVKIGEGTMTYEEKKNMEYVRNQRKIAFVREGDEEPMDVAFDFVWEYLTSATGELITVEEAVKLLPNAITAGWVTAGADPCEPYAVTLTVEYDPPCTGAFVDENTIMSEFRWESFSHDLKQGTVNCKGKCKILLATHLRN